MVDGPLKRQLDDLEAREAQGQNELRELEEQLKRLEAESNNLQGTKDELALVVNVRRERKMCIFFCDSFV